MGVWEKNGTANCSRAPMHLCSLAAVNWLGRLVSNQGPWDPESHALPAALRPSFLADANYSTDKGRKVRRTSYT